MKIFTPWAVTATICAILAVTLTACSGGPAAESQSGGHTTLAANSASGSTTAGAGIASVPARGTMCALLTPAEAGKLVGGPVEGVTVPGIPPSSTLIDQCSFLLLSSPVLASVLDYSIVDVGTSKLAQTTFAVAGDGTSSSDPTSISANIGDKSSGYFDPSDGVGAFTFIKGPYFVIGHVNGPYKGVMVPAAQWLADRLP